ncbi:Cas10/Cmr2 second palm domain-containing protein [Thermodesulfovibrio sp. TK110]
MYFGVILDTVSIQRYIFSTNNLKENLGASYIVAEKLYQTYLKEAIKEVFGEADKSLLENWEEEPEKISIKNGAPYELGYEGGGNAFILFADEGKAKEFIKHWSKRLLIYCPGVIASAAVGRIELDENFSHSLKALFETLAQNKTTFVPQTVIPKHGITADCARTGYSREIWCNSLPDDEKDYISSVANAKITAVYETTKKYREILENVIEENKLPHNYEFTNDLEQLGQVKNKESHIAIVHIDGNDMAKRFIEQKSLTDLRKLSSSVKKATLKSFKFMLRKLIEKLPEMLNEFSLQKKDKKTILPLRPIIIGGDDITFVSEGRLGVWLAKIFLEEFEKQKVSDGLPLSACAGVAITKTKYPFYRGYILSEQLLKNAKDKRKNLDDSGSWIDFHLSYGGFSGTLAQIRKNHYRTSHCELTLRPYKLSDLDELLRGVYELKKKDERGKSRYPRTKIMKLRETLYLGRNSQELFEQELTAKGLKLPGYKEFDGKIIVKDAKTPYLDMIELMEFYPDFALNGGE